MTSSCKLMLTALGGDAALYVKAATLYDPCLTVSRPGADQPTKRQANVDPPYELCIRRTFFRGYYVSAETLCGAVCLSAITLGYFELCFAAGPMTRD